RGPRAHRSITLDILGPSFSGSMQSIAMAIAGMDAPPSDVRILSASATVATNALLASHSYLQAKRISLQYGTLAASLDEKLGALLTYLCAKKGSIDRIEILAEESTFGDSVAGFAYKSNCARMLIAIKQFPPNIASIRAARSEQRKPQKDGLKSMLPTVG